MAPGNTDLARLREQTIGSLADEEAVTVNTRALIDKVLARYSGDWTTLRELIQNAADASAKQVTIRFETLPSRIVPVPQGGDDSILLKHTLQNHSLHRLLVSNDGQAFGESDWTRLKRIAEGNPDETKIGAFGVGFYSVFADCEEPFVISGRKSMAFLWKGNSLFTKSGMLPPDQGNRETTFLLNYRNTTTPIPDLMSLCQFLCTSLTFVGLETIDLYVDDWKILSLSKKSAAGAEAQLPRGITTKTKEGLMKVTGVVHQSTQIDARWMNVVDWSPQKATHIAEEETDFGVPAIRSLFSRLKVGSSVASAAARKAEKEAQQLLQDHVANNVNAVSTATVFLRISNVSIDTFVSAAFARELERATKKPPPKKTRIAILTSSHDEASASLSTQSGITAQKANQMFESVLPTKHGRIFIGFPTAQTTGLLCHISAPSVIPTVERESIDLNARYVKTWNIEMLRVAGIACRIAYVGAMEETKSRIDASMKSAKRNIITNEDIEAATPHALHIFKQYTATESTPSSNVGRLIEEAFWECSVKGSLDVLSTRGVLPSHKVRVVSEALSFVENVPVVPASITTGAETFIRRLFERGLITDMTVKDIEKELQSRSLGEDQLMEFLKWCSDRLKEKHLDTPTIQGLLESAVATIGSQADGKVVVLSQIKTFLSGSKVPPEMPVPEHTIPFRFTKGMLRQDLEQFGWDELQVVPWARYLVESAEQRSISPDQSLLLSSVFAKQFFAVISKSWDSLSANSKSSLLELLSSRVIMPTKLGLRKATDSYFPSVKLFDDLPVVDLPASVKEKVLVAMGVRKTIELTVVFDRLMTQSPNGVQKWSFSDLVRYLISVKDDIPKQDIDKLRSTAIYPVEVTQGSARVAGRLCKVSELFEPKDALRALGLPLLYWPTMWRPSGPEGRFLGMLGLRSFPEVPTIVGKMLEAAATMNFNLYTNALNYFVDHHHINKYAQFDLRQIADAPVLCVEGQSFPNLVAPNACFWNDKVDTMDFPVLVSSLRPHAAKFGVAQDPPITACSNKLMRSPPKSTREAIRVFGYLSGRLGEINAQLAEAIGTSKFVPIFQRGPEKSNVKYVAPKMCFLGDTQAYGDILDFVDFGLEANSFLLKVGSKHEPSSLELARMVLEDPNRILAALDRSRYTDLLRKLAENQKTLKADKTLWKDMKQSPFLLAYREEMRKPDTHNKSPPPPSDRAFGDDYEDLMPIVKNYALLRAKDVVVIDSFRDYALFRGELFCALENAEIESFYVGLGVPMITALVDEDVRIGNQLRDQGRAQKYRDRIIERTRLFLYEYQTEIRHDAVWLEKNLSVVLVDSVQRTTSLRGYRIAPHKEKLSAVLEDDVRGRPTLFLTSECDWYEISDQLTRRILKRWRRNDVMALEMVLTNDLKKLQNKGYHVDRILARKAHEERIAKEQKDKQEAEERKRREETRQLQIAEPAKGPPPSYEDAVTPKKEKPTSSGNGMQSTPMPTMPGAFGSPEDDSPRDLVSNSKKPNNIFSNLQDSWQGWGQQLLGNRPSAPAGQPSAGASESGLAYGETSQPMDPNREVNPAESERGVSRNLANAVQACRSHTSNSVFSKPQQTQVEEAQGSYCDSKPAHDIGYAASSGGGIKVYVTRSVADPASFVAAESRGIDTFSYILLDLGSIFSLPVSTLHIFHDERATIAFNQDGALFFNYNYFKGLHLKTWETSRGMKMDALAYWWVTMCHELAHNLVKEHSARHSFYTESFASTYFGKVMQKALQYS